MASVLLTIHGTVMNSLRFSVTNFFSINFMNYVEKENKRHDLLLKNLQRVRDKWNKDRIKRLDLLNKRLCEKNNAKAHTKPCLNITKYLLNE